MRYWFTCICVTLALLVFDVHPQEHESRAPPVDIVPKSPDVLRLTRRYNISYRQALQISQYAEKYDIPQSIAFRLVRKESRFDSLAMSKISTATGYTQILLPTARGYDPSLTRDDLLDPERNLDLGFRFLKSMNRRYKGDWWRTVVAYTDGPAVADTLEYGYHMYAEDVLWTGH